MKRSQYVVRHTSRPKPERHPCTRAMLSRRFPWVVSMPLCSTTVGMLTEATIRQMTSWKAACRELRPGSEDDDILAIGTGFFYHFIIITPFRSQYYFRSKLFLFLKGYRQCLIVLDLWENRSRVVWITEGRAIWCHVTKTIFQRICFMCLFYGPYCFEPFNKYYTKKYKIFIFQFISKK